MAQTYDTLRGYDRWHRILALVLLALLFLLPWLFGIGPSSWRACPALQPDAAAAAAAAAGTTTEQPVTPAVPGAGDATPEAAIATPAEGAPPAAAPASPTATPAVEAGATSALTDATAPAAGTPSAKVYFAINKYKVPADTNKELAGVIRYLRTHRGAKAQLVGFHDPTGNARHNVALAHNRALAVRGALERAGIARNRLIVRKPTNATGSGSNEEARRVEVTII